MSFENEQYVSNRIDRIEALEQEIARLKKQLESEFNRGVSYEKERVKKEIEKLQEQNKIMREALDFYSKTNHWLVLTDKVPFDITKWIRIVEDDMDQNNIGGKRAREALAEVRDR